jgi:hypothetical protein
MASYNRKAGPVTRPYPHDLAGQRIPPRGDSRRVIDLTAERRRRLARDLGLEPTVPAPCSGECRCYGAALGGQPA